jgi:hypothetical protein
MYYYSLLIAVLQHSIVVHVRTVTVRTATPCVMSVLRMVRAIAMPPVVMISHLMWLGFSIALANFLTYILYI